MNKKHLCVFIPYDALNRLDPTPIYKRVETLKRKIEQGAPPDEMSSLLSDYEEMNSFLDYFKISEPFRLPKERIESGE